MDSKISTILIMIAIVLSTISLSLNLISSGTNHTFLADDLQMKIQALPQFGTLGFGYDLNASDLQPRLAYLQNNTNANYVVKTVDSNTLISILNGNQYNEISSLERIGNTFLLMMGLYTNYTLVICNP